MIEQYRERLKLLTEFAAKPFIWLHPNIITLIGLCLCFIPAIFYIKGEPRLGGLALLVYGFDFIDGAVARLTGKVSKFGEVLDASLDRITDGLLIFSIVQGGFVKWNLAFFTLMGFFMVSYIRARTEAAAKKKIILNVGFAQRAERILILFFASVFYLDSVVLPFGSISINSLEFAFLILASLTWLTAIFRLMYAYKELNGHKKSKRK